MRLRKFYGLYIMFLSCLFSFMFLFEDRVCLAQAGSRSIFKFQFIGYSPPLTESIGSLELSPLDNDGDNLFDEDQIDGIDNDNDGLIDEDFQEQIFRWRSSDKILGEIDIGNIVAATWKFFPESKDLPARLVFSGRNGNVSVSGNALFGDYSRAVVDVTNGSRRVRYLVSTVFIDETRTVQQDFRPAPFGIFRTLSPTIKIPFRPSQVKVVIDDGDDSTDDGVFIESFFTEVRGEGIANIPETVPLSSVRGGTQINFRILSGHESDPDPPIRLFGSGENRLKIFPVGSSNSVIEVFTLHYRADDEGVIGPFEGSAQLPNAELGVEIALNHIVFNFTDETSDRHISDYLRVRHIRPQGVVRDLSVVQGRPKVQGLSSESLLSLIVFLNSERDPSIMDVTFDLIAGDPTVSSEKYPTGIVGDYSDSDAVFSNSRNLHYHHFLVNTFSAHRLIDHYKATSADVLIVSLGSGVGTRQNFSTNPNARNSFMITGRRLVSPTRIAPPRPDMAGFVESVTQRNDGDLRLITDETDHDTCVFTIMGGDGIGNVPQNPDRVVLGTGKDSRMRAIKMELTYLGILTGLEESGKDVNSKIHQIERSYNTRLGPRLSEEQRKDIDRRCKKIAEEGKIIIGAAWNEGPTGDVAKADAGRIAPDHNTPRVDLTGDNVFKKNVIVVGSSDRVAIPNVVESVSYFSNRGEEVSVVAPGDRVRCIDRNGNAINKTGTSFSTPIVTGIAAEILLIRPDLAARDKIHQVLEYIEATAEDIDGPGKENNTGHGRVSFWKAVLSAMNDGLSKEGRSDVNRDGRDDFFKDLALIDWTDTIQYGFEIRTRTQFAVVWIKRNDGTYFLSMDVGGDVPNLVAQGVPAGGVSAFTSAQSRRNSIGRVLPSLPFTQAELTNAGLDQKFVARFSIDRIQLIGQDVFNPSNVNIELWPPSVDPNNPGNVAAILSLPLNIEELRKAKNSSIQVIKDHVEEFDNFVFYITAN